MKVKGPWGWSGKHIISVTERGWMNRAFIIKHLQYERALSWCWGFVLPTQSCCYTLIPFGHRMKMPIKNCTDCYFQKTSGAAAHWWNSKRNLWHLLNVLSYHSPVLFFLLSGFYLYGEECWRKSNSYGNIFHIWWCKWDLTINDVVSISHVAHDYHCSCLESKEMQFLGCASRT